VNDARVIAGLVIGEYFFFFEKDDAEVGEFFLKLVKSGSANYSSSYNRDIVLHNFSLMQS
jgi:hypothetical protein